MEAYGCQGDQYGQDSGGDEDPPGDLCAVGIVFQPFAHHPPGDGDCDDEGEEDQSEEIAGQKDEELCEAGSQDFSYGDLLAALFGGKCCESQQSHTGDEDGKKGKEITQPAYEVFTTVESFIGFVGELVSKRKLRIE